MRERIFDNPHALGRLIVLLRLRSLDAFADAHPYETLRDGTIPVYYVAIACLLTDEQITELLADPASPDETNRLVDYANAATDFSTLPSWSAWSSAEAAAYVHDNVLSGWTQAQADAWIDSNVTSLAGARLALKQLSAAILTVRAILENIAKAILYLRNLVVRLRR